MRIIAELNNEIQELESKDMLTPQELRIVILKTMNHILSTYMFSSHIEHLNDLVNRLKNYYDQLNDSKIISAQKFDSIKKQVTVCMNAIVKYLKDQNI